MRLPWLPADPNAPFPPADAALREPDGLLAAGGDLEPERLLSAYRNGIFPWFSPGEPILWWCPDPRLVFDTHGFGLPRRLLRELRRRDWRIRADTRFEAVVERCADSPRPGQSGTWIGPAMQAAYARLHQLGHAHSIEVMDGSQLVGGLYGVAIGRMFFAESMFSASSGGSKVALGALMRMLSQWGWPLVDAQVESPHLLSLGAAPMPRGQFLARVRELVALPGRPGNWREACGEWPAALLGADAPASNGPV